MLWGFVLIRRAMCLMQLVHPKSVTTGVYLAPQSSSYFALSSHTHTMRWISVVLEEQSCTNESCVTIIFKSLSRALSNEGKLFHLPQDSAFSQW